MRSVSNPNYVKFSKAEMVVAFTRDRGELRTNDHGEFFFRELVDGRFTCVNPDLERRLIDLGYTAHQRVGIAKETHNRNTIWKVRLIDAPRAITSGHTKPASSAAADGSEPSKNIPSAAGQATSQNATQPHEAITARAPIPESKYAAAPQAWPEVQVAPAAAPAQPKPAARATESRHIEQPLASGVAHVTNLLRACLWASIDAARDAQIYATQNGFPLTFSADQVQDLASTLYIQEAKQSNIRLMNNRDEQRRAGGGDAWRH
jgi:hypothetical protein